MLGLPNSKGNVRIMWNVDNVLNIKGYNFILLKCLKFFMAKAGKERYFLFKNGVPVLAAQAFFVLVNIQCL